MESVEALIRGSSVEGTAAGLTGVGADAAEAVRVWGDFRKAMTITARMSKAPRAHIIRLYFFGLAVFVDLKGLDIKLLRAASR